MAQNPRVREVNPYYAAYLAQEPQPTNWGFIIWISRRWREFEALHGMKPYTGSYRRAEFEAWLCGQVERKRAA